jgi:8-oxo-dGTP diphosphatase
MRDKDLVQGTAHGAACVIFDGEGRVLLVHHTYGRLNWELPGGAAEPGEAPDETATRELLEETGLRAVLDRLTGVYFEPDHDFGPMLHFVFRFRSPDRLDPVASSPEVSDARYWPLDDLPTPISDFTERRIHDAVDDGPVRVERVLTRQWRE